MTEETFRLVITGAVAIATLCIFVMAVACVAMYRVSRKVETKVEGLTGRVEPLVDTVRKLADENGPRISGITRDAAEVMANARDVSEVAKDQAHRFAEVGRDITDRAKVQVARVDAVVDQTVEQVQQVRETVRTSVLKPVKEAGAVIAGVKAAVTSYASNGRRPQVGQIPQEEEMFI